MVTCAHADVASVTVAPVLVEMSAPPVSYHWICAAQLRGETAVSTHAVQVTGLVPPLTGSPWLVMFAARQWAADMFPAAEEVRERDWVPVRAAAAVRAMAQFPV